jgi:spermidine synthase
VSDQHERRAVLRNVAACYFLSGACGLVYQILWLRKLILVFGSTVHAVSTILTVFFGGLALGSWLFGRLIDRRGAAFGLRWYALLELGVGLYAFLTLPLFDMIPNLYIPFYRASGFSTGVLVLGVFACSAMILLVPTVLLGGTFPVLSRFLIRSSKERGVMIAKLYGINTAGAMAGTILVYYVGLPYLGLVRSLVCAGVLNIGIAAICWLFDRHLRELGFRASDAPPAEEPAQAREPQGLGAWILLAFGLSGFSAMVYEVAWTRALTLVLGSSIYAFCLILAAFLAGIALGSFVAQIDLRRVPASTRQVILIEVLLGVYGIISVLLFSQLPEWFLVLWPLTGGSFSMLSVLQVGLSLMVMIIPTTLMGFLFPLVSDLVTRRFAQFGRRLGNAYAVNTLGGILGSFLSGFVLIPLLGLPWTIVAAAMVNLLAAVLVYLPSGLSQAPRRIAVSGASLAGALAVSALAVIPMWQQHAFAAGVYLNPRLFATRSLQQLQESERLVFYRDSLHTAVSVHQHGEHLFLKVGGKTDASTGIDMATQVLSAHIPLLLHPHPSSVLVIGLGSGVTLGHAGRHAVSTLDCVEIEPAVVQGARWFKAHNYGVHDDPRAKIFVADGRNFLLARDRSYDVIISEPSNPWMAGVASLFTQEFYALAKRRLAPGGIMCQWLQLYKIFPGDVKLMLKTFHEAFPHVSVWMGLPGDLLLIGSMEPHRVGFEELAGRMAAPAVREALKVVHADRPPVLLRLFLFGEREIERLTADVSWVHEDAHPSIEFNAPKALYVDRTLGTNLSGLEQFVIGADAAVEGYDPDSATLEDYKEVARYWKAQGDLDRTTGAAERVVALDQTSSDSWRTLGTLLLQQQRMLRGDAALRKAIQLNPSDAETYRLLAGTYWQEGRLDEAGEFYGRAASLEAPDGLFAEEMGRFLEQRQEYPLAAECFRSSVSQGGGDRPAVIAAWARVLRALKAWEEIEPVLRFGAAAFPSNAELRMLFGEVLADQARWEDATPWFEQALALASRHPDAYYGLARAAAARGETAEAVRCLRWTLRASPYHRKALELLQQLTKGS